MLEQLQLIGMYIMGSNYIHFTSFSSVLINNGEIIGRLGFLTILFVELNLDHIILCLVLIWKST